MALPIATAALTLFSRYKIVIYVLAAVSIIGTGYYFYNDYQKTKEANIDLQVKLKDSENTIKGMISSIEGLEIYYEKALRDQQTSFEIARKQYEKDSKEKKELLKKISTTKTLPQLFEALRSDQ